MKLLAVAGAAVLTLGMAACGGDDDGGSSGSGSTGDSKKTLKVGLAFDIGGRGDKSFNDAAAAGLDRAKSELNVEVKDLEATANESENDKYERLKLLSFTGSPAVGWALKAKAGKKKVVLELGGNAAVVVDHDADLDHALERIVFGAFYQSGQSCIGVQRILIHESVYDRFKAMLVDKTRTLVAGNPHDRETFIGPMISGKEAQRLKGLPDDLD